MIDLNLFINKENTRIGSPWETGPHVFATNGDILIRVLKSHGYSGNLKYAPNADGIIKEGSYTETTPEELNTVLRSIYDFTKPTDLIDCPKCGGRETIDCCCLECGNDHTRTCGNCDGEGKIEIKNMSSDGFYRIRKAVPFHTTNIAYRYLKLIADTMKQVGGAWEVLITGPLEVINFRSIGAGVHIAVMPVRVEGRVS